MTTSWELVGAAQRGDQQAFGQLYARHVDGVFRYVLARVGDRVLAEDVTGETFLRAWRRIGTVQDQGKDLGAWLVTIARNLATAAAGDPPPVPVAHPAPVSDARDLGGVDAAITPQLPPGRPDASAGPADHHLIPREARP